MIQIESRHVEFCKKNVKIRITLPWDSIDIPFNPFPVRLFSYAFYRWICRVVVENSEIP